METRPQISICLTSYQRARSIGATLESLLAQELGDFELLIQDDASDEATVAVCRDYERRDRRIRFERNDVNAGMPGNLNKAIARARGELIANLHDGDIYRPDLLRTWRDAILRQEAAFVFNALEVVDGEGQTTGFHRHPFGPRLAPRELTGYMLERFDSPVWGTVMARAELYRAHGLFKPEYSFIADVEMWMRLNLFHPVAYVAEPLIKITPHEADRPYAYVNWDLERAAVAMREETAAAYFAGDGGGLAAYRRRLARLRRSRWLRFAASCVARGRDDLVRAGAAPFRESGDPVLRAAAGAARVAAAVSRVRRRPAQGAAR